MATAFEYPAKTAPSSTPTTSAGNTHSCPACGTSVTCDTEVVEARRTIEVLEAQLELFKAKNMAAMNKCADYEEEIRNLRTVQANGRLPRSNTSESLDPTDEPRPSTANSASAKAQSRFSFLTGRRPSPGNSPSTPPLASESDLLSELERERALRAKAEDRARTVDSEIEELSVQLFSQANEMVADERRARAKLEERIEMLEKKDKDKVARLDRLEKALSRLDRVKALLNKENALEVPGATGATLAPRTE